MDALMRIFEEATTVGLSRVITYLLMIPVGIILMWVLSKYTKRRLNTFVKQVRADTIDAVKQAPAQLAKGAANSTMAATGALGRGGIELAKVALDKAAPIAQGVGQLAVAGANKGAVFAQDVIQVAAPVAKVLAVKAADAAGQGAKLVADGVVEAAPHVKSAATVAYGSAKNRAGSLALFAKDKWSKRRVNESGGSPNT